MDTSTMSLVDPAWEYLDPTPDIFAMFQEFDKTYFGGTMYAVELKWSKRMTSCAGIMAPLEGKGGACSIRLSEPLLKLRPRKDLVQTLLHEMIHAHLHVTRCREKDPHGPQFKEHMNRINKIAGTNITVYHNFHDEVNLHKQHWWRCNGSCRNWRPYYGWVKRATNRAPSKNDFWWPRHQQTCGGQYIKVKEPEGYSKKKEAQLQKSLGKNGNLLSMIKKKYNLNHPVPTVSTPKLPDMWKKKQTDVNSPKTPLKTNNSSSPFQTKSPSVKNENIKSPSCNGTTLGTNGKHYSINSVLGQLHKENMERRRQLSGKKGRSVIGHETKSKSGENRQERKPIYVDLTESPILQPLASKSILGSLISKKSNSLIKQIPQDSEQRLLSNVLQSSIRDFGKPLKDGNLFESKRSFLSNNTEFIEKNVEVPLKSLDKRKKSDPHVTQEKKHSSGFNPTSSVSSSHHRKKLLLSTSSDSSPQRKKSLLSTSSDSSPQRKKSLLSTSSDSSPQRKKSLLSTSSDSSPQRKKSLLSTSSDSSPQRKKSLLSTSDSSPQRKKSLLSTSSDSSLQRKKSLLSTSSDSSPQRKKSSLSTSDSSSSKILSPESNNQHSFLTKNDTAESLLLLKKKRKRLFSGFNDSSPEKQTSSLKSEKKSWNTSSNLSTMLHPDIFSSSSYKEKKPLFTASSSSNENKSFLSNSSLSRKLSVSDSPSFSNKEEKPSINSLNSSHSNLNDEKKQSTSDSIFSPSKDREYSTTHSSNFTSINKEDTNTTNLSNPKERLKVNSSHSPISLKRHQLTDSSRSHSPLKQQKVSHTETSSSSKHQSSVFAEKRRSNSDKNNKRETITSGVSSLDKMFTSSLKARGTPEEKKKKEKLFEQLFGDDSDSDVESDKKLIQLLKHPRSSSSSSSASTSQNPTKTLQKSTSGSIFKKKNTSPQIKSNCLENYFSTPIKISSENDPIIVDSDPVLSDSRTSQSEASGTMVACPVCQLKVPAVTVNNHLDECLNMNCISQST